MQGIMRRFLLQFSPKIAVRGLLAYVCVYDGADRNRRKGKLELELTASQHR